MSTIRDLTSKDATDVLTIYAEGIASEHATFETKPPTWDSWDASHHPRLRYLAVSDDDTPLGWVSTTAVSTRAAYSGVAELGVYVTAAARGRGIGYQLLQAVVERAPQFGVWMLQSTIFPENSGSLAIHQKAGFRVVGRRERIALMQSGPLTGQWRDVVLVEKRL